MEISWEMWGKYFGYPKCCIDFFVSEIIPKTYNGVYKPPAKLAFTGFVPCPKCNKIKTEDQMISEINKNRLSDKPFPETSSYKQDVNNIKKLIKVGKL